MPCFDVNTKLGSAMKVSFGRPVKVNNFLTTLNITLIANKNLKKMKGRPSRKSQLRRLTRLPLMLMRKKWIRGTVMPDITQIAAVHLKTGF
ncbi:hypothetical protein DPMN_133065 [Dreissena polymorpha]|uniref:Uncharacterized protein n=1 Tax=Dreissena polymorpha TaxID=45954 RepID=A0A9D4FUJ1_DREPO|nr:hypothetical protein DPMN_133065 [Dreissena polymorpha]